MRILVLAVMVLVAAGLAGCGSSQNTADTQQALATVTTTKTVAPTDTSSDAPISSTTTPPASSTTTPPASTGSGPPPCRASGLALSFIGQQGATGHGELGFAMRNTGAVACSTVGYPGVEFLDKSGSGLTTRPTHTTDDLFGHSPLRTLLVAPGQSVSFRLGVTHGAASQVGCTTAYGLQVIPPNDTASVRVAIPGGGAYECQTATVSPLRSGDTAYP